MAANRQYYDLHGISMTEEGFEQLISVEGPYRYELIFSSLLSHIQAIVRLPARTASSLTGGLISIALYDGRSIHIFVSLAT